MGGVEIGRPVPMIVPIAAPLRIRRPGKTRGKPRSKPARASHAHCAALIRKNCGGPPVIPPADPAIWSNSLSTGPGQTWVTTTLQRKIGARQTELGDSGFIEFAAPREPLRQAIESVNQTLKGQLDLERHGGRTGEGILARILALTAAIWRSDKTGQPAMRSLIAYDH